MRKEIIPIVQEAIKAAGGQHMLAKILGVTPQRVHNWLRNGIPAKFVIQVAWHSGVSRHKLRPDIYPEEK